MASNDQRPDQSTPERQYRTLPKQVRLDETIAGLDTHPVLDADAVRNVDQHGALRDD